MLAPANRQQAPVRQSRCVVVTCHFCNLRLGLDHAIIQGGTGFAWCWPCYRYEQPVLPKE